MRTKIMSMRYLRHAGLLVITLTISVLSFAQAEKYQGTMFENMAPASFEWAANRLATLDQLVTLTDAQKEEVEVINMRYAYRMDALARQTMDPETLKAHREGLFDYRMEDYKRILNPEQVAILVAHEEDLKEDNLLY
ncbi:MAG: hypothetical protein R2767_07560 [Chitinophagales bacterium]